MAQKRLVVVGRRSDGVGDSNSAVAVIAAFYGSEAACFVPRTEPVGLLLRSGLGTPRRRSWVPDRCQAGRLKPALAFRSVGGDGDGTTSAAADVAGAGNGSAAGSLEHEIGRAATAAERSS